MDITYRFKTWLQLQRIKRKQQLFRDGFAWAVRAHYEEALLFKEIEDLAYPWASPFDRGAAAGVKYLREELDKKLARSREQPHA